MEDKIKLILQYMNKEKELMTEFDREEGINVDSDSYEPSLQTVSRVNCFIKYRNIRIEEAWYVKLTKGNKSREVIEKLYDYDNERSRRHSMALTSIEGLNAFAERHGLPKFYEGQLLKPEEIDSYKNIPVRNEMTNFFLKFIDELNRTPNIIMEKYFEEVGIEREGAIEDQFIRKLQMNLEKTERDYGVEKPLVEEHGDIKFKDDKNLDDFAR